MVCVRVEKILREGQIISWLKRDCNQSVRLQILAVDASY